MLLHEQLVPPKLYANYGRLSTMLVKVAMILAAFDTKSLPVRVEGGHVYRAQTIVEGWRDNLHRIMDGSVQTTQEDLTARILQVLDENPGEWTKRRDVTRALGLDNDELEPLVVSLKGDGKIEMREYKPPRGPSSVQYRRRTDE
jgi:hypothetical protein